MSSYSKSAPCILGMYDRQAVSLHPSAHFTVLHIYFQILKKWYFVPLIYTRYLTMKTYFLDCMLKSLIYIFTSAGGCRKSFTLDQRAPGAAPSSSSSLLAVCPIKHGWQVEASEGSCPCRFTGDSYWAQQGWWICGENTMLLGWGFFIDRW